MLDYLDSGGSLDGADEPLRVYLTLYLVLRQAGDARAAGLLETAARLLDERASRITDEAARRAFLENIEHHREIRAAMGVR